MGTADTAITYSYSSAVESKILEHDRMSYDHIAERVLWRETACITYFACTWYQVVLLCTAWCFS